MKVIDSSGKVVIEGDDTSRFMVETKTGVFQIMVGNVTGDLYITGCTKPTLACMPCGGYNCIHLSQVKRIG